MYNDGVLGILSRDIFNSHLRQSFDRSLYDTEDIETDWTMFSTFITEAALSCGCKMVGALLWW